jgi:hypothetical protein
MLTSSTQFQAFWEEVNYLLDRRAEPTAEFLEAHENADLDDSELAVDMILMDRARRERDAREAMEDANALAADYAAYTRRIG